MKTRNCLFGLLMACLVWGCEKKQANPPAAAQTPAVQTGVSGLEVKDRLGEGLFFPRLSVADHLGNRYETYQLLSKPANIVLLVDAFCPACAEEAQKIQRFTLSRPDLNLFGISKDSAKAVIAFKKSNGILFPILLDRDQKLVPDYRRVNFPTLVIVGPDKKIIKLYEGNISAADIGPLLKVLTGRP